MFIEREAVERKQCALEQYIREAEESKGRGDPGAAGELERLKQSRVGVKIEMRQATNKDYILDRNRKREIRTKFQKIIDAVTGER